MHGGRITIFLDESDQFLTWPKEKWNLLSTLRGSMSADHCRYIVAGFEGLIKELSNAQSPLYMAFEPLRLRAFEKKETEEVILRPI